MAQHLSDSMEALKKIEPKENCQNTRLLYELQINFVAKIKNPQMRAMGAVQIPWIWRLGSLNRVEFVQSMPVLRTIGETPNGVDSIDVEPGEA